MAKTMIGLVACSKKKLPHPAPARYLSPALALARQRGASDQGTLFRYASAYAQRECHRWYILSAEHGLVRPDQVLAPYERSIVGMLKPERERWALQVAQQLTGLGLNGEDSLWLILAGRAYTEPLLPHLAGTKDLPLAGLGGYGYQVRWLQGQVGEIPVIEGERDNG